MTLKEVQELLLAVAKVKAICSRSLITSNTHKKALNEVIRHLEHGLQKELIDLSN